MTKNKYLKSRFVILALWHMKLTFNFFCLICYKRQNISNKNEKKRKKKDGNKIHSEFK